MPNGGNNRIHDVIDEWAKRRAVGYFLMAGFDVDTPIDDVQGFDVERPFEDIRDNLRNDFPGWEEHSICDIFSCSDRFPYVQEHSIL